MGNDKLTLKQQASLLLRKYDHMRTELRKVERDLHKACADYGRAEGLWGFNKDHLRIQLDNEDKLRIEMMADQAMWEKEMAS